MCLSAAMMANRTSPEQQLQSLLSSLNGAADEISGQADLSVSRWIQIGQRIGEAARLEDVQPFRAILDGGRVAIKQAAEEQRSMAAATVERLREHCKPVAASIAAPA